MSHLDAKAGRRLAKHLAEGGGGAGVYDRLEQNARRTEVRRTEVPRCATVDDRLCALRPGGQQHRHHRQRVDEELARIGERHRAGQADEPAV